MCSYHLGDAFNSKEAYYW